MPKPSASRILLRDNSQKRKPHGGLRNGRAGAVFPGAHEQEKRGSPVTTEDRTADNLAEFKAGTIELGMVHATGGPGVQVRIQA